MKSRVPKNLRETSVKTPVNRPLIADCEPLSNPANPKILQSLMLTTKAL